MLRETFVELMLVGMWPRRRHTPLQLIAFYWGGVGFVLVFLLCARFIPQAYAYVRHPGTVGIVRRLVLCGSLIAPCFACYVRALTLLKQGIRHEIWTEQVIEPARKLAFQPFWNGLMWTQIAVLLACAIFDRGRFFLAVSWSLAFIATPQQLRETLRKPGVAAEALDWSASRPVHSEHWGAPRTN